MEAESDLDLDWSGVRRLGDAAGLLENLAAKHSVRAQFFRHFGTVFSRLR